MRWYVPFSVLFVSACVSAPTHQAIESTWRVATAVVERPERARDRFDPGAPISRAALQQAVVARDNELAETAHRVRAMLHGARAAGSLPAPEVDAQVWNLPLRRPYALGDAGMYMLGVMQMFPPGGMLDGHARAMAEEARAMAAMLSIRERELARMASDAYAEYVEADLHSDVHRRQLELLLQMVDAARGRYAAGMGALADIARIELEITREHRELARVEGGRVRVRAEINILLRRASTAPLGAPADTEARTVRESSEALEARAARTRGALQARDARLRAAEAREGAARAEARWPMFGLGLSYMQDPRMEPGAGLSVRMTLPWLWGGFRDREAQAGEEVAAERAGLEQERWAARGQIASLRARLDAAVHTLAVLRGEGRRATQRSLEAVRIAYASGQGDLLGWIDAARMALDFALEEGDLAVDMMHAVGELEQAVGEPLATDVVTIDEGAR